MNIAITPTPTSNQNLILMDILANLMEKAKVNINQLSKNTGLANTTIKRMCIDPNCNPTLTSIIKIAEFFNVTPNQLIGKEPLQHKTTAYYANHDSWHTVPIIQANQALLWPTNLEEIKNSSVTEFVKTDLDVNNQVFAFVTQDESLEPKFSAGTILIFDPQRSPKNKDYVLLIMEDKNLPQFRQILIDGPDIYAKTINPAFSNNLPILLKPEQVKILGTLIQAKANYIH